MLGRPRVKEVVCLCLAHTAGTGRRVPARPGTDLARPRPSGLQPDPQGGIFRVEPRPRLGLPVTAATSPYTQPSLRPRNPGQDQQEVTRTSLQSLLVVGAQPPSCGCGLGKSVEGSLPDPRPPGCSRLAVPRVEVPGMGCGQQLPCQEGQPPALRPRDRQGRPSRDRSSPGPGGSGAGGLGWDRAWPAAE